jgi:hypothetical protein
MKRPAGRPSKKPKVIYHSFRFAIESKTKKAESDSPCAIATKVECPPLTNFVD